MTFRKGNIAVLCKEDAAKCEFCGKVAELRPYGPNRERICFQCMKKDEATAHRVFGRDILGLGETH
jgi:hypothetical protein